MIQQDTLERLEYPRIIERLTDLAYSEPGKRLCRQLLPTAHVEEIQLRLKETEDAIRYLLEQGSPSLSGISDLSTLLGRAERGAILLPKDLLAVVALQRAANRLHAIPPEDLLQQDEAWLGIYDLMLQLDGLVHLTRDLERTVQNEDSLADDASPQLREIRTRMRGQQQAVREHLERVLRQQGKALQDAIVTQRNGRYVIPVRADHRAAVPGLIHDASNSGQTLFIEPMAVVKANNKLRELEAEERAEVERILRKLSAQIAERADTISQNGRILAKLDFIFAKGRLALDLEGRIPKIRQDGRFHLLRARHPLIPAKEVVPIDLSLGDRYQTLVITGPNTGGKTVALKTCGLLTLMGMAGLAIPAAEASELAIFEQVFADIGDEQSIEQSLSTFSAHMQHIVEILEQADGHSLVLLDELGSGTDPSEGAALAIAILEHLRQVGARILASTHYRELKTYALQQVGVENASCEFDVESLSPTYRLLLGVPGVSNAFLISQRLGLDENIIESAKAFLSDEERNFEAVVAELDDRSRQLLMAENALAQEREALAQEKAQIQRQKRQIEVREQARKQEDLSRKRQQRQQELEAVESLLAELRLQFEENPQNALDSAKVLRQAVRQELNQVEKKIGRQTLQQAHRRQGAQVLDLDELVVGQRYRAEQLGLEGKLLTLPDRRGLVQIEQGAMKIKVPAKSLSHVNEQSPKPKKQESRSTARTGGQRRGSQFISAELKLLGKRVDEALIALDQYLDEAVLAGVERVRIVHGKGSGALRSAVHEALKQDKRVKCYRLAEYGEGDSGVTWADLR